MDPSEFVEGLSINLISISQLCDQGYKVNFTESECLVINKKRGMVMKGVKSKDNCYEWVPQGLSYFSSYQRLQKEKEAKIMIP